VPDNLMEHIDATIDVLFAGVADVLRQHLLPSMPRTVK